MSLIPAERVTVNCREASSKLSTEPGMSQWDAGYPELATRTADFLTESCQYCSSMRHNLNNLRAVNSPRSATEPSSSAASLVHRFMGEVAASLADTAGTPPRRAHEEASIRLLQRLAIEDLPDALLVLLAGRVLSLLARWAEARVVAVGLRQHPISIRPRRPRQVNESLKPECGQYRSTSDVSRLQPDHAPRCVLPTPRGSPAHLAPQGQDENVPTPTPSPHTPGADESPEGQDKSDKAAHEVSPRVQEQMRKGCEVRDGHSHPVLNFREESG
jgi:hypothetical protein